MKEVGLLFREGGDRRGELEREGPCSILERMGNDGKHIANALSEALAENPLVANNATTQSPSIPIGQFPSQSPTSPTVAKFAIVQKEGGREAVCQVEYYNFDVVLSAQLTARLGKGWRARNLREIRRFFLEYSSDTIRQELLAKFENKDLARVSCQIQNDAVCPNPQFKLIWFHYLMLMRVAQRRGTSCVCCGKDGTRDHS